MPCQTLCSFIPLYLMFRMLTVYFCSSQVFGMLTLPAVKSDFTWHRKGQLLPWARHGRKRCHAILCSPSFPACGQVFTQESRYLLSVYHLYSTELASTRFIV